MGTLFHIPLLKLKLTLNKPFIKVFILLICIYHNGLAQTKTNTDENYSKVTAFDTTYIYKYESKLVVGPCLSYRNYNVILYPQTEVDSLSIPELEWRSPSNRFWGIDFSYDKFGFTFSFANVEPKSERDKKGESSSSNFGFSYGGNRCFIESSLRTYKGFYEKNSLLYDTTLSNYYQSPNLESTMFNFKIWYFTNHHQFAFKSCYGGLYRQLKTRTTWAFSSNLHFNSITTDSSMVPDPDRKYFGNALTLSSIGCAGISVFGGGALNFVIRKAYFFNFCWVLGPDFQSLTTQSNQTSSGISRQYINYAHEIRIATGFNLHAWYLTFTANHEITRFNADLIKMRGRHNSISFNLGYRFGVKKPSLYSKFQNTWFYSMF